MMIQMCATSPSGPRGRDGEEEVEDVVPMVGLVVAKREESEEATGMLMRGLSSGVEAEGRRSSSGEVESIIVKDMSRRELVL